MFWTALGEGLAKGIADLSFKLRRDFVVGIFRIEIRLLLFGLGVQLSSQSFFNLHMFMSILILIINL